MQLPLFANVCGVLSTASGPEELAENSKIVGFQRLLSATTAHGSTALPFVISTGEIRGLGPTQDDEKRFLFGHHSPGKHRPPLCHLDRSAA
jgi:hypothetical protein